MALSANTVWEVRQAGNDNNGGGFVTGASGTDFSQQNAAQYTFTDLASTNGTNASPQVTSASHSFVSTDVGNIIQITAGTNWTATFYEIKSVSGGAATLDKACGSAASLSSGTYAVGGALASPGKAAGGMAVGNIIWVKAGTYSITSATANVAGGRISLSNQGSNTTASRISGYNTTRGDAPTGANRPTLQASGITSATIITTGVGNTVEHLIADGNSGASNLGFSASNGRVTNCWAKNCPNGGFSLGDLTFCEASGNGNVGFAPAYAFRCFAHDNTGATGFQGGVMVDCIAYNNSIGFFDAGSVFKVFNCTAVNNTSDGLKLTNGFGGQGDSVHNFISYGNTGWGINSGTNIANYVYQVFLGSNTAGAVTGSVVISGQVNLSADPFTNRAGLDFSLNTTAGGGAAVRAAGLPGTFPGSSTTSYLDGGAVQHQDPAGASIYTRAPIMRGL